MIIDIPIKIIELEDESYHIMLNAVFNGNIQGNLIVDTGASKTVFDISFVEQFITDVEDIDEENSSGINAMIAQTKTGIIPALSINKFEIENYKAVLLDLSHINAIYGQYTNMHIAGLIGSDFLVKYDAVINYGAKIISLNI
jgi:S-adenosylhomocysteine hydrolase